MTGYQKLKEAKTKQDERLKELWIWVTKMNKDFQATYQSDTSPYREMMYKLYELGLIKND